MRFIGLTIATLVASASMIMAAPVEAEGTNPVPNWSCPKGWKFCGTCNGTSCKIAGWNYDCKSGTSCVGKKGGDGALCGSDGFGDQVCPVKV